MAAQETKELVAKIVQILDDKKGNDISIINIHDLTVIADYFVIVNGTSVTQVRALSDELEYQMKEKYGVTVDHIEGYGPVNWVLMDFGGVVVHVFLKETRQFYNLERLWADGEEVPLSDFVQIRQERGQTQ